MKSPATKRQLLSAIKKETKPPKGFSQWVIVLERRRLAENLGLLLVEAALDGKPEWSASMSVSLPEPVKLDANGQEIAGDWPSISPGESAFNVFTLEMRGKSIMESAKGWLKRSFDDGKLQDLFPLIRS